MDGSNLTDYEFERVVDLVSGRLSQDESAALRQAAGHHSALDGVIRRVEELVMRLSRVSDERVEPGLIERVKRLYDATRFVAAGVERDWISVVATLVEDTREREALAGFRGVATSYQLTFDAGGVEVHLQVTPVDDDPSVVRVMGQIDSDKGERVDVLSLVGGDVVVSGACDDHGYFTLELGVGTYDLAIVVGNQRIIIRAVEMG